jgi:hypothetical protein
LKELTVLGRCRRSGSGVGEIGDLSQLGRVGDQRYLGRLPTLPGLLGLHEWLLPEVKKPCLVIGHHFLSGSFSLVNCHFVNLPFYRVMFHLI